MWPRSIVLLIASAVHIIADDYCAVCQDGSDILYPEKSIEETDQTCAALAEEASRYSDPIACRYYHRYGNACGCKNIPPAETYCHLCQQGNDQIEDRSFWLDGYGTTCGVLQTDASWNLWATYSADEDDPIDVDQDDCNYYHHVGSLCGCKHNRPPHDGCPLCADGSQPLLPEKTVTPNNAAEGTCSEFSLFTQYQHVQGTTECNKLQLVVGSYCGCANTPIGTSKTTCDFCPEGLVTREGWAPDVDFATSNRVFYFRDAACIKIAMLAATFDFPCGSAPRDFIEGCCQPASELLQPEVFVQQEPPSASHDRKTRNPASTEEAAPRPLKAGDRYKINWDEFVFSAAGTCNHPSPFVGWFLLVGYCATLHLL